MRAEPLQATRVHRFYRGGALLGRLRGEPEEDGFFPEDWLGSVTPARNPGRNNPEEGLSRLAGGRMLRDATYTGVTPTFWATLDAVAGPEAWKLNGLTNCGKGQPGQSARVSHGASPCRFRDVRVGVRA